MKTENIQESVLLDDSIVQINTSSNCLNIVHNSRATSNICKTAKTTIDNIKTSLKSAKNKHSQLIICGKGMKKLIRQLRELELNGIKNMPFRAEMREFQKIRRDIKSQQHNTRVSFV